MSRHYLRDRRLLHMLGHHWLSLVAVFEEGSRFPTSLCFVFRSKGDVHKSSMQIENLENFKKTGHAVKK